MRLESSTLDVWLSLVVVRPVVDVRLDFSDVGDLLPPVEVLGCLEVSEPTCMVCLRSAIPLFKDKFMPGKPSLVSCRGAGVAVGSIDTAERTGKTLSIEPGLRADEASSLLGWFLLAPGC